MTLKINQVHSVLADRFCNARTRCNSDRFRLIQIPRPYCGHFFSEARILAVQNTTRIRSVFLRVINLKRARSFISTYRARPFKLYSRLISFVLRTNKIFRRKRARVRPRLTDFDAIGSNEICRVNMTARGLKCTTVT